MIENIYHGRHHVVNLTQMQIKKKILAYVYGNKNKEIKVESEGKKRKLLMRWSALKIM